LAAQTTQNLTEWKKAQEILKKLCTNARIFDTICSVTEKRQTEAAKLARECDRMIVIGGRASSNTAKLFAVCKAGCDRTVWISRAEELASVFPLREIAETHQRVGIAAGASTPSGIIEEVYKNMCEFENFAELLESSIKTLNTGDIVTGIVTSVTDGELQLDLGAKVTGVITADQVADTPVKLTEQFKIGDTVEAFVIRVSDLDGFATLSKKRVDSNKNWVKVQEACDTAEILTGTVVEAVKGGVVINYDAVRIFVPGSHTGIAKDGDLTVLVGQEVRFRVIEIKDQGRGKRAIGSIRVVQREERRVAETEFWANIEEGKTYTGTVKSMTSYGAFIDLGGVDGMVHKSELSWRPISTPASVLAIGDTITVFVKSFDAEKKRISLGYKTEETNPWYQFIHTYGVGDVATVKVVSMMPFGAFAEILPGVDGLIHISQIALNKIAKPADVLEIGQEVDAKIIGIDEEKQKISLSIRALLEETEGEEAAAETAE
jgi:4-hydroxy-3-methylbut-2-enyl diphosphate reductase